MIHIKHFGDICKISGYEAPAVNVIIGGSPCFAAGTLITTDRGLVPIEDVKIGDSVFTHNRRFMKVVDSGCTGRKATYNLRAMACESLIVTENHPIYARKYERVFDSNTRTYNRKFHSPEFVAVSELSKEYYVGVPINSVEENPLNITEEEAYLLGRYVADGYVDNSKRADRKNSYRWRVLFCIGKSKIDSFKSRIREHKYCASEQRTAVKLHIWSHRLVELCSLCGKGAINKQVPQQILNLPKNLLEIFFDSYMEGDGCFTKDGFQITTISKKLAYGMCQVIGKLYNHHSGIHFVKRPPKSVIEGRVVNTHDFYQVKFTKEYTHKTRAFYEDGYIWCPIRSIEPNEEVDVYNLSVADDQSYCANNIAVHNCQDLSVAGKRAGLAGARSGLFMEQIRIIKEMRKRDVESGRTGNEVRPRFMVWEQVPGVYSSNAGRDFAAVLEEIVRVSEPDAPDIHVPKGGWTNSGCIMGRQWSIAWRVLDAQFWGVPQRRRRIVLIADFSGRCAPEVLFERNSSEGHFESGEAQGQGAAGDASDRSGTASDESGDSDRRDGRGCLNPWDVQSKHILPDDGVAETLYSAESRWGGSESYVMTQSGIKCLNPEDSQSARIYDADGVYHSLNANSGGGQSRDGVLQPIAVAQNQRDEVRDLGDVSGALSAEPGVKQQTYVAIPSSEQTGCLNPEDPQSKRVFSPAGVAPTLASGTTEGMNIVPSVIQESPDVTISFQERNGCDGGGQRDSDSD